MAGAVPTPLADLWLSGRSAVVSHRRAQVGRVGSLLSNGVGVSVEGGGVSGLALVGVESMRGATMVTIAAEMAGIVIAAGKEAWAATPPMSAGPIGLTSTKVQLEHWPRSCRSGGLLMRAIQVAAFGGPEVLSPVRLPDPVPAAGQVVVGMRAADVIFLDTLLRSGWGQSFFPQTLPYVPGGGGAGVVLETGRGVDPAWIGRPVVVQAGAGYAQRVVVDAERVVPVPSGLSLEVAAALVHDGVTALRLERLGRPATGEWVLIAAAAGGAGSLLVQLAVEAGARVVAAASNATKLALARELGAEVTVDYTQRTWIGHVRAATGGGAALVYDGAGGPLGTLALDAVADGGRFITYGTADGFAKPNPELATRRGIRVLTPLLDGRPDQQTVREMLGLALQRAAEGQLRPTIGATYPLERATEAHRALATRTTVGKSLLLINEETSS